MSSSNENGTEKNYSSPHSQKASSTPAPAAAKTESASTGGLVKAPKSEIIELSDRTRVVESDSLPNRRPIALSNLEVVDSLSSAGMRPVMGNTFEVATTETLPGHRPIAVSTLEVSSLDTLPGHRPIASNDIDEDPFILMGYLD